eukprot:TRINITY_DN3968_c0_g1_i1.p1 TRINITY_DN3968_c0_g1~~TRINITY_DN3968_c0_g1_i1.p1  ORF type:complete len:119 (-),score=20.33 TRINITY_DN3968_c0_g1_i1:162-518(-)
MSNFGCGFWDHQESCLWAEADSTGKTLLHCADEGGYCDKEISSSSCGNGMYFDEASCNDIRNAVNQFVSMGMDLPKLWGVTGTAGGYQDAQRQGYFQQVGQAKGGVDYVWTDGNSTTN